jgi:peroxiredoxin
MIDEGDTAPDFTASVATAEGELDTITLSDRFDDAPLVLAFFPAAFSGTCTDELNAFREELDRFAEAGATVFGVSTDLPWALREFAETEGLDFDLIGDHDRAAVEAYGVRTAFPDLGLHDIADRAVFVIDGDRTVTYAWLADDPGQEPPYEDVIAATEAADA